MRLREAACNDWLCIVDNDVKPLDLTKPDVFALLGKDLKTRDVIRVFPLDNSYFAELVVLVLAWAGLKSRSCARMIYRRRPCAATTCGRASSLCRTALPAIGTPFGRPTGRSLAGSIC